ncbi:MAG: PEP-CTERM sorting domain-containing protein [Methylococcaceae bacterium]|nr:PEP-CTERM sorting domain-containing protein [Methylococcaceae bacterium]
MNKKIIGLTLAAAFTASTANAALIDDFNGTATLIVAADGSVTDSYGAAIGGFRTVDIIKSGPLGASAGVIVPPGIYSHSADALTSATSNITWDADGSGLGGVDLVEGLINNVFAFDILSIDQGSIDLILSISDILGGSDAFTFSNAGQGIQEVSFASFSGIDFTQVNSISLQVVGGIASDLTLDSLGTSGDIVPTANNVPEPTSLALLGMGLVAFGFGRRKA